VKKREKKALPGGALGHKEKKTKNSRQQRRLGEMMRVFLEGVITQEGTGRGTIGRNRPQSRTIKTGVPQSWGENGLEEENRMGKGRIPQDMRLSQLRIGERKGNPEKSLVSVRKVEGCEAQIVRVVQP